MRGQSEKVIGFLRISFLSLIIICIVSFSPALRTEAEATMSIEDGLVTTHYSDRNIVDILSEVQKRTGILVKLDPQIRSVNRTISVDKLPIEDFLKKALKP